MTADVVPIRRAAPVPLTPPDAEVITLPIAPPERPATPTIHRGHRWPTRRGQAGHHPDCPYASHGNPQHCGVCQGLAKGQPDHATA